MDWNRWESSFDPMFWMTPEERQESVQQEKQEGEGRDLSPQCEKIDESVG